MDIENQNTQNTEASKNTEKNPAELYKDFMAAFDQMTGGASRINPDLISGKKKLISCRYEIIFNINARVMEEDETGNPIATTAICTKNYHIPVPSDKDYDVFMEAFFEHLESCLANATKSSSENQQNKENSNG